MKDELLAVLREHFARITALLKAVKAVTSARVYTVAIRNAGNSVSREWFDRIKPLLENASFSEQIISLFSSHFEQLLRFTRGEPTKGACVRLLTEIANGYKTKLIHEIEVGSFSSKGVLSIAPYIEGTTPVEGDYLDEAQRCLTVRAIRACIVLGWCATIARIHEKISEVGFSAFNKASEEMAGKQYGRFKPFKKIFKVEAISELRGTVFDTDLLWVLEYLELIDGNQHERLRYCFGLRNHSAHPGQAPIEGENLYAFYSDITRIVLKNPKFKTSGE